MNAQAEAVVVECDLPDAPEKVWRALTVPEVLAAWLAPNDIRPEVGARFRFRAGPDLGAEVECEVLAAEAPRFLSYRWQQDGGRLDTVVSFELTPTVRGGTHLRLVHDGFPLDLAVPLATLACSNVVPLHRRAFAARGSLQWAA